MDLVVLGQLAADALDLDPQRVGLLLVVLLLDVPGQEGVEQAVLLGFQVGLLAPQLGDDVLPERGLVLE